MPANGLDRAASQAVVDMHVLAKGPTQLIKALLEYGSACFCLTITRVKWHEHPNAPPLLLRARNERPRGRAAE